MSQYGPYLLKRKIVNRGRPSSTKGSIGCVSLVYQHTVLHPDNSQPDQLSCDNHNSVVIDQTLEVCETDATSFEDHNEPVPTESDDSNTVYSHVNSDKDVFLHLDSNDKLVTHLSWLDNYLLHGEKLVDVCFWDYVSRIEKVSKSADCRRHKKRKDNPDPDISESEDDGIDMSYDSEPTLSDCDDRI